MQIKNSVGKKGVNSREDVELVQITLNRAIQFPFRLLAVDKLVGKKTIGAIESFQKQVLKFSKPDGLVEVKGKTWQALSKYLTESPKIKIATHATFPEFTHVSENNENQKSQSIFSVVPPQHQLKIAWGAKVSPAFKQKVIQISKQLEISPDYLMACIAFETGETFSPSIKNAAGSGAVGLIQFMPQTAIYLKTNSSALEKMSAVDQLDYVKKYFNTYKGKLHTLEDVYMAILLPTAIGKPVDHIFFRKGTKAYEQNIGLDKNKDGKIVLKEVAETVRKMFEKGIKPGYMG